MITNDSTKEEIVEAVNATLTELLELYVPLTEEEANKIPYEGSWTPSQLLDHIRKSTNGIATALMEDGKAPGRDAAERVPELKAIFLDYANKMKSPDGIVPGDGPFEKDELMDKLKIAFEDFAKNANHTELDGLVMDLPFGPITKLELLHFVVYHTTRHLQQLKRICTALQH